MDKEEPCTSLKDALRVLMALNAEGYPSRFAGGCVRDRLLGIEPKDYDIATTAKPNEVKSIAQKMNWKTVPTGLDHGTVTIVTPSNSYEVTTLRKDVRTDGRHAVVDFEHATFEDDAARRDFTINALFEDETGKIYDYYGGQQDLRQKILRFVGNPSVRISEDYLRILRFFRFWSQLDFTPDPDSLAAIPPSLQGLSLVSQERITNELWKIISGPASAVSLRSMQQLGVLSLILPDCEQIDHSMFITLDDAGHRLPPKIKHWTTLVVLMGITKYRFWDHVAVQSLGKKLRWSDQEIKTVMAIFDGWSAVGFCERKNSAAMELIDQVEALLYKDTVHEFLAPIWFFCADHAQDIVRKDTLGWVMAVEATWGPRRVMALPISGRDVMELRPDLKGSAIGEVLNFLKQSFRNNEWNTRSEGIAILGKYSHQTR